MARTTLGVWLSALMLAGASVRVVTAQAQPASIVGAWVLNQDLSDHSAPPPDSGDDGRREGRGGGRGGGGRGGGRGGFGGPRGGGFGGRGGGADRGGDRGGPGSTNREEMQRRMDAVRAIVEPADRLTIVRTDSMVIVTTGDGRTTRLAPDNSKIKDGASGVERRSRWEGDRLVTDISGLGRGKATETYAVDPQTHQLVVTFDLQGAGGDAERAGTPDGRGGMPGMRVPRRRVYDPAQP